MEKESDRRHSLAQGLCNKHDLLSVNRQCDGVLTCSDIVFRSCVLTETLLHQRELCVRHDMPARILRCRNFFSFFSPPSSSVWLCVRANVLATACLFFKAYCASRGCARASALSLANVSQTTPGPSLGKAFVAVTKPRPLLSFNQTAPESTCLCSTSEAEQMTHGHAPLFRRRLPHLTSTSE